jgi:hypothetical protein
MLIFGIGAAAPLVVIGSLSRVSVMKVRGRLLSIGRHGKQAFGIALLVMGTLVAIGVDKSLEGWILDRTPDWLTTLTTRF